MLTGEEMDSCHSQKHLQTNISILWDAESIYLICSAHHAGYSHNISAIEFFSLLSYSVKFSEFQIEHFIQSIREDCSHSVIHLRRLKEEFNLRLQEHYWQAPKESWKVQWLKHCNYNNQNEDYSWNHDIENQWNDVYIWYYRVTIGRLQHFKKHYPRWYLSFAYKN